MLMDGIELYSRYEEVNKDRNCEIDPWESLHPDEQEMWDELARRVTADLI